jgi:murein DD-endopeptidase MepM/ murein hydrolase activator NlpD
MLRFKKIERSWSRFPQYIFVLGIFLVLFLNGCAATIYDPETGMYYRPGRVYHTVKKGETLWRIAKIYNVSIEEIVESNKISNAAFIEANQRIFIPGARELKKIYIPKDDPNKDEFAWPIRGEIIRYFNTTKDTHFSKGICIKANDKEIVEASRQGQIVFADYLSGYDYTLIIDHLDGYLSVYSRNSKLLAKEGDFIYKGDPVARVGKKGRLAFLYFEIREGTKSNNPLYYLPKL